MTKLYLLLLLFICLSCSEKKEITSHVGEPYFDFDEVLYYKGTVDSFPDMVYYARKHNKTKKDSVMIDLMSNYPLTQYSDSICVIYLDSIGLNKVVIPKQKHIYLREIFTEKNYNTEDAFGTSCDPTYRDIFAFKKDGKVSGIARICLQCGQFRFTGSKFKPESFGFNDEYVKLRKLNQELE